jgi:hypothetical protein
MWFPFSASTRGVFRDRNIARNPKIGLLQLFETTGMPKVKRATERDAFIFLLVSQASTF